MKKFKVSINRINRKDIITTSTFCSNTNFHYRFVKTGIDEWDIRLYACIEGKWFWMKEGDVDSWAKLQKYYYFTEKPTDDQYYIEVGGDNPYAVCTDGAHNHNLATHPSGD